MWKGFPDPRVKYDGSTGARVKNTGLILVHKPSDAGCELVRDRIIRFIEHHFEISDIKVKSVKDSEVVVALIEQCDISLNVLTPSLSLQQVQQEEMTH